MTINKIHIYNSGSDDLIHYLKQRFNFFLKINKAEAKVLIIENTNMQLSDDECILFFLDSVKLASLIENESVENFFNNKSIKRHQKIILLFGIEKKQLPHFMNNSTVITYPLSNIEGSSSVIQLKTTGDKLELNNSVFDLVHYLFPKNNGSLSKVFVGPYDGNAKSEFLKVMRELTHRGYNVIDYNYLGNLSDNEELVNTLKEVDTSVHFLSHESLKDYPKKGNDSIKVNSLVSEYCDNTKAKLKRIVYIPPIQPDTADEIIHKVEIFKRDKNSLVNAEIIQSPIERLKGIVLEYLQKNDNNKFKNSISDLYVIFSLTDREEAMKVVGKIEAAGLSVCYPDFSLSRLELLSYHQKCLVNCTGVLIFNTNNANWLVRKANDVLKAPGWGRKSAVEYKYICGNKPEHEIVNSTDIGSYTFIDDFRNMDFIEALKKQNSN